MDPCHVDVPGTQNLCTLDKGHSGEHRCSAGDVDARAAKTRGIAPATGGSLAVLQHEPLHGGGSHVHDAAREIASYHPMDPDGDQQSRLTSLAVSLADFLEDIVRLCPPGPERSTAISRAREAKFWAAAAISLEGL